MDEMQLLGICFAAFIISVYAAYNSLRSKAHSYWNAEDIAGILQILTQEFPQYFEQEAAAQPDPEEVAKEPEEVQEVPA